MKNSYFERILHICEFAGQIARQSMNDLSPSLKPDQSVLTKADQSISQMIHQQLRDLIQGGEHIIVDEEDDRRSEALTSNLIEKKPYVWAIDPIDGTRVYANKLRHFAVSIGLLKDLKPWLGAVYFPALAELFYFDGEAGFFVENAFGPNEMKTRIVPVDQEVSSQSIFFVTDNFSKRYEWDYKDCHLMIPSCAAADLCWPTIGRGCGAITKSYLWDFAGSWPILKEAGLSLRSFESGTILEQIQLNLFDRDRKPWMLNEPYLLSSEKNFPLLRSKITRKPDKVSPQN